MVLALAFPALRDLRMLGDTPGIEAGTPLGLDLAPSLSVGAKSSAALKNRIMDGGLGIVVPQSTIPYPLSLPVFTDNSSSSPAGDGLEIREVHSQKSMFRSSPQFAVNDQALSGKNNKDETLPFMSDAYDVFIPSWILKIVFEEWLNSYGKIEWDGGARYETVQAKLRLNDYLGVIQVEPAKEWVMTPSDKLRFPELKNLEKNKEGPHPEKGAFGQIEFGFYAFRNGPLFILIETIQPGDGYPLINNKHRKHLDAWRNKAALKVVQLAELHGMQVFASTPEAIQMMFPELEGSDYLLRKNYIQPFDDGNWIVQNFSIGLFDDKYEHLRKRVLPWYAYKGNANIDMKRLVEEISATNSSPAGEPFNELVRRAERAMDIYREEGLMADGLDIFYQSNIPGLREQIDDVISIVEALIAELAQKAGSHPRMLMPLTPEDQSAYLARVSEEIEKIRKLQEQYQGDDTLAGVIKHLIYNEEGFIEGGALEALRCLEIGLMHDLGEEDPSRNSPVMFEPLIRVDRERIGDYLKSKRRCTGA